MADLTPYTTIAADTVRAKAAEDAARLTEAETAGVALIDSLPVKQRIALYAWMRDNQ